MIAKRLVDLSGGLDRFFRERDGSICIASRARSKVLGGRPKIQSESGGKISRVSVVAVRVAQFGEVHVLISGIANVRDGKSHEIVLRYLFSPFWGTLWVTGRRRPVTRTSDRAA